MVAPILVGPDAAGRWLVVADGVITRVGDGDAPAAWDVNLDCSDATIELGAINAHTHMYSGLAPLGMPAPKPPPDNFVQILERVWWRLDRALDERSLRASARLYAAESALFGTTTLIDHHESPNFIEGSLDVLADALDEIGLRGLLCYGATERNGGRDEARRGLAECERFVSQRASGLLQGGVGLHASFTVSDDTVMQAGALCRALQVPLHVHVAEDQADVSDAKERGYEGVVERLLAKDAVAPGSIFAHGVHLDATQVARSIAAGAWFVQNPRSNLGNDVGYAGALRGNARAALGTDGYPADMIAESAALVQQAAAHDDHAATASGRMAAGRALSGTIFDEQFALAEGAAADIVVRDETGVRHVLVAGEFVVRDGRLTRADIDAIRAEARTVAPDLWARMERI